MSASITATSTSSPSSNWIARNALRNLGTSSHAVPNISNVMIADEHGMMRDVLYRLFDTVPFVEIVAHAADGHEALQACRAYRPDIVMMELQLPLLDGVDVIRTISRRWPQTRILVLSADAAEVRVAEALNAGARGYVLKRSGSKKLLDAVDALRAGRSYIDAALNVEQVEAMRRQRINEATGAGMRAALTTRERQVLKLIAEGGRNRDIAQRLTISQKTVETHRMNMMQKLDAHNVAELVKWAHRLGITAL